MSKLLLNFGQIDKITEVLKMFLNFDKAVALTTKNTSLAGHWQLEIQKRVQTE